MVIAFCPLQDTFLQNTFLRVPGASVSFIPLVCLALLAACRRILRNPLGVNRGVMIAGVYVILVCVLGAVEVSPSGVTLNFQSVPAFVMLTLLYLFTVFGIEYRNTSELRAAVYIAFALTIVGLICGQVLGANAIPALQTTPSLSGRPHGFSTEPSTLSVHVVAIGMLTAHFLRKRWQKASAGVLTFALLVFSSSKGGLIALLLCALVLGIARSRSSRLAKVLAALILIPVSYFGSLYVSSMFGTLIEANQTETIATRLSMVTYAFITVLHHPFGVGFTGFFPSMTKYLPVAMQTVQRIIPIPLAFAEVEGYLYPPYTDADCKAFFFNYLVFFGIPFAFVFIRFFKNLLGRLLRYQFYWLFLGILFALLALTTYYSTLNAWTVPVLLGIALHETRKAEAALRMQ